MIEMPDLPARFDRLPLDERRKALADLWRAVRAIEQHYLIRPGKCPGCERGMSAREASEQGLCNDCHTNT